MALTLHDVLTSPITWTLVCLALFVPLSCIFINDSE